jgi:hypothetical protein
VVELVPRSTVVARVGGDLVARPERLPPVLAGASTPAVEERVRSFLSLLAEIFETWVARRKSPHTQRAYRQDVMAFVGWMGFEWPRQALELLTVSVVDVQAVSAHEI